MERKHWKRMAVVATVCGLLYCGWFFALRDWFFGGAERAIATLVDPDWPE